MINLIFLKLYLLLLSIEGNLTVEKELSSLPYNQQVVYIEKIYTGRDSILLAQQEKNNAELLKKNKFILGRRNNNISFQISGPDTGYFSFKLENFDKEWSRWQKSGIKDYTNLPARKYLFRARCTVPGSGIIFASPVEFKVVPLWYYSYPAILFYIMIFGLLVWAVYEQLKYRFARTQYMLEQIINARTEELIIEKEKTENLLANVLPKNTADELMAKGKVTKIKYNFVTVLFSDIQGFTKIAEETNPEVLIDELDKFFFHFDSVVEKYGIEKIKTIGDAYMCAGGIPEKNRTNPVEVILAALEMQEYMNRLKSSAEYEGMKLWDIRIGIHTGTVVAGVVGQKKLSYDIWGDTVNTASRMESSGEPGKINISGTTYEFVKDFFICKYRGKMPVKYKGEIDMYFVEGIKEELRDENNKPNRKFITKVKKLKLNDIEEYILKYYDDEAPPNLYFHSSAIVRNICNQVDLLATAEQIRDEDYIPLKLAAVFLFTGYISDYHKSMEASCSLMEEILPRYGLLQEDVDSTRRLIINSFSNITESLSDFILHDARYDYLGRVDYIKLMDKLLREETEYGIVSDRNAWIQNQRNLLIEHEFITSTAKLLRSVTIEEQVALLHDFGKEIK
ncbi:MAG: adenylate/guanylate cyclase domain-containing protein [Bacteroidales bacterium]